MFLSRNKTELAATNNSVNAELLESGFGKGCSGMRINREDTVMQRVSEMTGEGGATDEDGPKDEEEEDFLARTLASTTCAIISKPCRLSETWSRSSLRNAEKDGSILGMWEISDSGRARKIQFFKLASSSTMRPDHIQIRKNDRDNNHMRENRQANAEQGCMKHEQ